MELIYEIRIDVRTSDHMNGFILLIKSKILNRFNALKQSLLFYPLIFSVGALIAFLITARVDQVLNGTINMDVPYLNSLIFAGSPTAARSVLSAIATGWATILGVAFSVTLITLQLATTKFTSHIVSRFEDDKTNQFTLGWFVSVVIYSLLVLKTVRTGEDTGITFTPTIGVNVAVFLAILALFIFVLFLYNISSYLRPNKLAYRLTDQIISAVKKYERRKESHYLFQERLSLSRVPIYYLKCNTEGLLRYIDWSGISNGLQRLAKVNNMNNIQMDWSKSLGEWIETDSILARIYGNDRKDNYGKGDHAIRDSNKEFDQKLLSSIEIAKNRDIRTDPQYGIEILRSLAVKSIDQFDTDIADSCVTGIFRIILHLFRTKEKFGASFELSKSPSEPDNNRNEWTSERRKPVIIINPKESKLRKLCFEELSLIYKLAELRHQDNLVKHFLYQYISLSKDLLSETKIEAFETLTKWYKTLVINISFKKDLQGQIVPVLLDFENEISKDYPYATTIFAIHMKEIIDERF